MTDKPTPDLMRPIGGSCQHGQTPTLCKKCHFDRSTSAAPDIDTAEYRWWRKNVAGAAGMHIRYDRMCDEIDRLRTALAESEADAQRWRKRANWTAGAIFDPAEIHWAEVDTQIVRHGAAVAARGRS